MKRIIKPFTLEVRNGRRRKGPSMPSCPTRPEINDQPEVQWPKITISVYGDALPGNRTVCVPPIDEKVTGEPFNPFRAPRTLPTSVSRPGGLPPARQMRSAQADAIEAPTGERTGRVLPVVDVLLPAVGGIGAATFAEMPALAIEPAPVIRGGAAEPIAVPWPADCPSAIVPPSATDAKAVAATLVMRPGGKRLTRDEFGRGERWKARLPAAVHRAAMKKA